MVRAESAPCWCGEAVHVKAVAGTHVVVLAWNLPSPAARKGLLGFAIRRTSRGQQKWLPSGGRCFRTSTAVDTSPTDCLSSSESSFFDAVDEEALRRSESGEAVANNGGCTASAPRLSTREAPIQAFSWCDYTGRPGDVCEYFVCPVYAASDGGLFPPCVREDMGAVVRLQMEDNGAHHRHEVWFNRGTAGSQAYSRLFGMASPAEVSTGDAWKWLSRGLGEALLAYVERASGPGWMLRGAFYEFTWRPVLEAFARAAERGVDVRIVVDFGSSAPRAMRASNGSGERVDLKVQFVEKEEAKKLGARWDAVRKVWYAPRGESALLERWGPRDGPLAAALAIDEVPGLRDLIVPRENCKGISHNKFIVLLPPDGGSPSVWTGSTNLTESGIYGQSNVAHVVNGDVAVADEYLEYWGMLASDTPTKELAKWNAERVADDRLPLMPKVPPVPAMPCAASGAVMSPRPSLALLDHYAKLLATARHCSCMTAAFGVNKQLADVLGTDTDALRFVLLEKPGSTSDRYFGQAATRVACGAVLSASELDGFDPAARGQWTEERLTGLNEHVMFVHNKFMLLDPLTSAPAVVSGSANFSQASVERNDENMLFVAGDTRLADLYFVEFWRLFQHFRFRDRVRKKSASSRGSQGDSPARQLDLHLVEDDSWVAPFYTLGNDQCRNREFLMSLYVAPVVSSGDAGS